MLQFPIGGRLGINETTYQPMKIAAAEANWDDLPAVLVLGVPDRRIQPDDDPRPRSSRSRTCCPLLATGTWDGQVQGLSAVNEQYNQQYGPGYYVPNVFIQYWSMRVMAYLATLVAAVRGLGAVPAVAQEVRDLPGLPVGAHLAGS